MRGIEKVTDFSLLIRDLVIAKSYEISLSDLDALSINEHEGDEQCQTARHIIGCVRNSSGTVQMLADNLEYLIKLSVVKIFELREHFPYVSWIAL